MSDAKDPSCKPSASRVRVCKSCGQAHAKDNLTWYEMRVGIMEGCAAKVLAAAQSCLKPEAKMDDKLAASIVCYFLGAILEGDIADPNPTESVIAATKMTLVGPPFAFGEQLSRRFFADFILYDAMIYPALSGQIDLARLHCSADREQQVKKLIAAKGAAVDQKANGPKGDEGIKPPDPKEH